MTPIQICATPERTQLKVQRYRDLLISSRMESDLRLTIHLTELDLSLKSDLRLELEAKFKLNLEFVATIDVHYEA